jgi:hypothetical protein
MASDDVNTANDMVVPDQLANMPGAPFDQTEVDIAVATVRKAVMWHIAPIRSETHTFDVPRMSRKILLPTAKLISVDQVRGRGDEILAADYEASTQMSIVKRLNGFWPEGYDVVEVDMTHGYDTVPEDLLTIVAAVAATTRRDQAVREAVAGTYTLPLVGIDNVIYRYVPWHKRFGWA